MECDAVIAGFGFRSGATVDSLRDALHRAGGQGLTHLATAEDKAQSPVFQTLGETMGLPVVGIAPDLLQAQGTATTSNPSLEARGTGSVAEAAALAAAGPGAELIRTRVVSGDRMATCALAEGKQR
ncbi:cobalamin biosynthesis protein [Mameliella sediminis]|uniref:cobalamin biosynthesis protein n=1 Tax=Mameliella sediminis TaxID=2836866 RepID=UPI001C47C233|nr:cobalamin biosynthesis protein [Mameliella sediminis]MBV7392607.1 cobalamin biosynthesis protein [Mameliella sediminis]